MKAKFELGGKKKTGEVIDANHHTIWVRLRDGNIIKRHKVKHNVLIKS
jgi:hypothetical protein